MSVTAAQGFVASGVACGIKADAAPDLALVATDDGRPVAAAAVTTRNLAAAAPVLVTRAHLDERDRRVVAVILNSGNANAATGPGGRQDAEHMCVLTASELGCDPVDVLVCSTGLIGIPLPMATVEAGVGPLAAARAPEGGADAAEAIRTTDTHRKEVVVDGGGFTVGGMAKGAAMCAPDMATMLAVLTTDAEVDPMALHLGLAAAVETSFNALSIDGCTSTNDTVIVLASGRAGDVPVGALNDALATACADLAAQMAGDAEGATKVVRVRVRGAADHDEAVRAARKVADSQLVKCSWYGADPYWGRIVSELGSAGVDFELDRVSVAYGGIPVCVGGQPVAHDEPAVGAHMAGRHLEVVADLGLGDGEAVILTNDLSHAYVDENMGTS